jgi:hypothetical protein
MSISHHHHDLPPSLIREQQKPVGIGSDTTTACSEIPLHLHIEWKMHPYDCILDLFNRSVLESMLYPKMAHDVEVFVRVIGVNHRTSEWSCPLL